MGFFDKLKEAAKTAEKIMDAVSQEKPASSVSTPSKATGQTAAKSAGGVFSTAVFNRNAATGNSRPVKVETSFYDDTGAEHTAYFSMNMHNDFHLSRCDDVEFCFVCSPGAEDDSSSYIEAPQGAPELYLSCNNNLTDIVTKYEKTGEVICRKLEKLDHELFEYRSESRLYNKNCIAYHMKKMLQDNRRIYQLMVLYPDSCKGGELEKLSRAALDEAAASYCEEIL